MVLDTSAIIAAIANEPDGPRYQAAMFDAGNLLISAVTVFETKIVLFSRLGSQAVDLFNQLVEKAGIVVVPFDDEMAKAAFEAYRRSGRDWGIPHN